VTVSGDITTPVQKAGVFEDIVDVFVRPARLFERERTGSFVKPALIQMIVLLVLAVALHNLIAPFVDADMQLQTSKLAAQGKTIPESATAMQEKMASVGYYAVPLLAPWLIGIIGGLVLFLTSRIVGAKPTFSQSATISSWAYMPGILGTLVMAIFGAVMDPTSIRSTADGQIGLARLVDPVTASPALFGALRNVELFTLWGVVITAIGVSVVARTSRGAGFTAAVIKWLLVVALTVVPAILFS
jgi:hypothetical protein